MSSSPFELFRRNLKPMMVFLTLLALVSFVILPSVAMYQQQQMGGGGGASTLASYKGGDFEFNKVNYFTRSHFATTQFLRDLAEITISRGGSPKVADFQYDSQNKVIQSLGINSDPSDQASVRTLFFAGEAKKAGLELDDTAIRNWLTLYSDGRLSDSEINGVLARSTRNQLGQIQLYEQLRTQLLAQAYQRLVMSGLTANGMPIVPPAQQWELFLRLNRQATADAYAVNVADFIDKTNAKPSEAQITEVYEDGKSRFPDEQSPKPAFRRPYKANIEYVAGSLNDFITREIATLTEEQLRAEYQKRLDGGDFKLPDPPPAAPTPPTSPTPPDAPDAPAAAEAPASPQTPAASENPATPPADDSPKPDSAPPAETPEPTAPAPTTPEPTTPEPADDAPQADAPASEPPAEAPAPSPDEGDSSQQSSASRGVRLVALQAADQPSDENADEPAAAEAPAQEEPKEEPPAEDNPAEDNPAEDKPAEDKPAEDKPAEDKPAEDKPAEDKPAEDKPAGDKPTEAMPAEQKPAEEKPPAVEPFEKVRDQIARSLAMQPALDKLDAAVSQVDSLMQNHFKARVIAGAGTAAGAAKAPAKPDLKALAEKLGMQYVVTGLVDAREIQEDPIALSSGVGTGMQRGEPFVQTMYGSRSAKPPFSALRTVDDQAQVSYVSWKIDEKAQYIPELKDIRDEVITAVRTAEARRLAKAEADRFATEFNTSEKPAKELIPAERSSLFFESLGPFSWMNSLGFGMRAFIGNVPELDRVGEAFMRQVFTSDRGQWGVAPNMPETVFYVVRPTEFTPSTEELHKRFAQPAQRMQTMSLAVEEAIKVRDGHYEALDQRTGFQWNEEALNEE